MLTRYQWPDTYTTEELKREYIGRDERGRIRLLRWLARDGYLSVPHDVIALALQDEHVQVRQWIARNAPLWVDDRRILARDPDPFVRACLWENANSLPHYPSEFSKRHQRSILFLFRHRTRLERLALMRNPGLPTHLVEHIFDPADTELGVNVEEREELVRAVLSNAAFFRHQKDRAAGSDDLEFAYPPDYHFFKKIWELASQWPVESGVRSLTYRYVVADDETKARWYKESSTYLRGKILDNCARDAEMIGDNALARRDFFEQTLKLAVQDEDDFNRQRALELAWHPERLRGGFDLLVRPVKNTESTVGFGDRGGTLFRTVSVHFEGTLRSFDLSRTDEEVIAGLGVGEPAGRRSAESGTAVQRPERPPHLADMQIPVDVQIEFTDQRRRRGRGRRSAGSTSESPESTLVDRFGGEVGPACIGEIRVWPPDSDSRAGSGTKDHSMAHVNLTLPFSMRRHVPTTAGRLRMEGQIVESSEQAENNTIDQDTRPRKSHPAWKVDGHIKALVSRVHFTAVEAAPADELATNLTKARQELPSLLPFGITFIVGESLMTSRTDNWLIAFAKTVVVLVASGVFAGLFEHWREKRRP
jgi:hypothetical protein